MYGLMRGDRIRSMADSKRARNWKRRTLPRIDLTNAEPVLYSTQGRCDLFSPSGTPMTRVHILNSSLLNPAIEIVAEHRVRHDHFASSGCITIDSWYSSKVTSNPSAVKLNFEKLLGFGPAPLYPSLVVRISGRLQQKIHTIIGKVSDTFGQVQGRPMIAEAV